MQRVGGGSRIDKHCPESSSDPDLLFLILEIEISMIDPSEAMGIYINTSTENVLKDIVLDYQAFTHTFLLSLKES